MENCQTSQTSAVNNFPKLQKTTSSSNYVIKTFPLDLKSKTSKCPQTSPQYLEGIPLAFPAVMNDLISVLTVFLRQTFQRRLISLQSIIQIQLLHSPE